MRALVTGGAGFLGLHLARSLVEDGARVTLVDSLARGRRDRELDALLATGAATLIEADLEDPEALGRAPGTFDEVYHLAAVVGVAHVHADPGRALRVNLRTLLNVLDFHRAGGHGRLFFASTSEVYAWTMRVMALPVPTPEDVPTGVDRIDNARATYALSKIAGEMLLAHDVGPAGHGFVGARFHNVYGPRMGSVHVIPELYLRMRGGERPLVVREARATRAFCHVDDAVAAVRHLMASAPDGIYNIGNDDEEITVGALARRIADAAGYPRHQVRPDTDEPPAIPRRCPDLTRLRGTGFAPRIGLDEGLARTVAWYRDHHVPRGL